MHVCAVFVFVVCINSVHVHTNSVGFYSIFSVAKLSTINIELDSLLYRMPSAE